MLGGGGGFGGCELDGEEGRGSIWGKRGLLRLGVDGCYNPTAPFFCLRTNSRNFSLAM